MRKRILSIFLALVMYLSLLPTAVFAEGENDNGIDTLSTTGVRYIDENGNRKTAADCITVSDSAGDVIWENGGWYVVSSDVTISGKLTIKEDVNFILCDGKNLTVEGGILAYEDLTIYGQSGGTGNLTAGDAVDGDTSKSIVCDNLTVNGGSINATGDDVTGTGMNVQSYGINCAVLTINGGKITAVGGSVTALGTDSDLEELTTSSYGIRCKDITINGGSIDATAGAATCSANVESEVYSYGIKAYDVTLKNGTVKATSGTVTYDSDGENQESVKSKSIGFDFDDLTMENGTITATAGKASTTLQTGGDDVKYRARSLALHGDDMIVSGGTVNATADDAAVHIKKGGYYASTYSCGIYADLTVSGGTINAYAGENAEALLDLPSTEYEPDEISARVYSCGIISYEGDMVYTGGTVNATFGSTSFGVGADYEGDDYSDCAVSHNFGIYSYEGRVSVTGGKIAGDVGGSGKVNISGGKMRCASTEADATLTISGGTMDYVSAADDSTVIISGGTVKELYLSPDAAPVLTGGTFESITWAAEDGCDAPNLIDALADGYAYYVKGSGSTTYDTLIKPVSATIDEEQTDWCSTVENVQVKAHTCDFVKTGDTYACDCGRTGKHEKLAYLDKNGTTQYRVNYTMLDSSVVDELDGSTLELSAGWYAVSGEVTLTSTINLKGDVHLILCDNAKLSTTHISDDDAYDLTFYAQSTDDKMGSLFAGNYTQNIDSNIAISLDGDLTVVGGNVVAEAEDYGIYCEDLTVLGGTIKCTGNIYGIYISEEITVSGGIVEGVGGSENNDDWGSTGIRSGLLYVTGGKIIGTGGATHGNYSSKGIYVIDGMTVTGGIVEGTGGQASGTSYYAYSSGINVYDDVIISGGTVTGKSTTTDADTTSESYGFYCWDLTVSGGNIIATAGEVIAADDSALSYGLYCEDLTVSGGSLTATGTSAGVYSYGSISANGGKLTAKTEQTGAYDSAALYVYDKVTLGSSMKITTPADGTVKLVADDDYKLYTVVEQDSTPAKEVVIQKVTTSDSSSSSGGGSSSGSDTTSTTVTNPDESTTTTITDDNSKIFSDVPANAYFADAVKWASARKITGGTSATTFSPNASCTRAQLVTFLWRAAGQPKASGDSGMTDVAKDSYYSEAVAWAVENGIVSGYGNGLFGTEDVITREQTATILYRFAQYVGMDTTQGGMSVREYTDYDSISDYAISAVQWTVNTGIMTGYNNNIMPGQPCTRAQIVTMLYRLLG